MKVPESHINILYFFSYPITFGINSVINSDMLSIFDLDYCLIYLMLLNKNCVF